MVALASIVLIGGVAVPRADAGTTYTTHPCIADTYIDEGNASTNYGTEDYLRCGGPNYSGSNRRDTLVKFDLSGISEANGPIVSATLYLLEDDYTGIPNWRRVWFVTSSWSEGSVTWNSRPSYDEGSETVDQDTWWSGSVLDWVDRWIDDEDANYGLWLTVPPLDTATSHVDWVSRESSTSGNRPYIYIVQQTMGGP